MRPRIDMHKLQELVRLHRMGTGAREVARLLRVSPNTERDWRNKLDEVGLLKGPVDDLPSMEELDAAVPPKVPRQQISSVAKHEAKVRLLRERGAGPKAIYDRLRLDDPDFKGTYWAIKRLCARLDRQRPVRSEEVAIPVETAPGKVAQVDFGYAGRMFDPATGKQRRAWVFVMVLGHSRHMFAKIVFDQRAETWLQLHVEAFAFLGGVPAVLVPDNLKSAVVRAAFGLADDPALNRSYCELARHYGFQIDPTPPYEPQKKGKVERGVRYVKNNALKTMPEELNATEANRELERWVLQIAGTRAHGTTGFQPLVEFEQVEKAALLAIPAKPFVPVVWKQAKVHRDSHIVFDKRLYSVPWKHLGEKVWVRATPTAVAIYADNKRVADHSRSGPVRSTIDAHLPGDRRDYRHRGRAWWQERALGIDPEVHELIKEIFDDEQVLHPLRKVQNIVVHLEGFPKERARNAARRARRFCVHDYRGIKDILRKALDLEPLPPELPLVPAEQPEFRFTRPVQQMLDRHLEGTHEYH